MAHAHQHVAQRRATGQHQVHRKAVLRQGGAVVIDEAPARVDRRLAEHLVGRQAEDAAGRRIGVHHPGVQAVHDHADIQVGQQRAQALLVAAQRLLHAVAVGDVLNGAMKAANARSGVAQHIPAGLQRAGRAIRTHKIEVELVGARIGQGRLNSSLQAGPAGRRVELLLRQVRRHRPGRIAPEQNLELLGPGDVIACHLPLPTADAADALRFAHRGLGPFEPADVGDVGDDALDLAVNDVGQVVGQAVPCLAARAGHQALESLGMPQQGLTNIGLVEREQRRAEQVLQGSTDQVFGVDPEPRVIGLVGELAAQIAVPVGHHRRRVVQQPAAQLPQVVGVDIALLGHGVDDR